MVASLAAVPAGRSARIVAVTGAGDVRGRLLALGFTPGCEVAVLALGPLGGPLAVSCRGAVMALRRSEAACIQVE